mgnify:CR=1 FL=1
MFLQRQMTTQKAAKPSPSGTIDLRVGDRIRHKTFGEGTILAMEKMGNDTMLEIGFDLVGTKRLWRISQDPNFRNCLDEICVAGRRNQCENGYRITDSHAHIFPSLQYEPVSVRYLQGTVQMYS